MSKFPDLPDRRGRTGLDLKVDSVTYVLLRLHAKYRDRALRSDAGQGDSARTDPRPGHFALA
jgi:hypothetical protein